MSHSVPTATRRSLLGGALAALTVARLIDLPGIGPTCGAEGGWLHAELSRAAKAAAKTSPAITGTQTPNDLYATHSRPDW